jgi:hypothetical protein
MKKVIQVLMLVVSLLFILMACSSSSPQDQVKEIDELLNKDFPITVEEKENIEKFTAKGNGLLKEGKTPEASEAFAEAIKILKMAQDADIFNKAD